MSVQSFANYFDALAGQPGTLLTQDGLYCLLYQNKPQDGFQTVVSYGVSQQVRFQKEAHRPEFCLCVESLHEAWALLPAWLGKQDSLPVQMGSVVTFPGPLAPDTTMDALILLPVSVFEPLQAYGLNLNGNDWKTELWQWYPIFQEEIPWIRSNGLDAFVNHEHWDPFAVDRPLVGG